MIFISINIYSFYVADQDTARYSFCSVQEKCASLAEPYTTDSFNNVIQCALIPVKFFFRFIKYQNRVKVITFSIVA